MRKAALPKSSVEISIAQASKLDKILVFYILFHRGTHLILMSYEHMVFKQHTTRI